MTNKYRNLHKNIRYSRAGGGGSPQVEPKQWFGSASILHYQSYNYLSIQEIKE
jgi:hypothetical protein